MMILRNIQDVMDAKGIDSVECPQSQACASEVNPT